MSSSRPVFKSRWLPYALVAPQLIITVIFFIWPAGEALWYSLQSVDPFGLSSQFVGLDNFVTLFHDGYYYDSLAPLYDTVPTVLWPNLRAAAAMSVNRKRAQPQITVDDLAAEALTWGLDPRRPRHAVVEVTERVRTNVAATVTGDELASVIAARTEALLASA